jgi:putative oxidoreductase
MFAQHGAQKLFGWFADPQGGGTLPRRVAAVDRRPAGARRGVLIAVGLFARRAAFLLSGLMAVAYFMAHASQGPWPILNRGELAVLYCFVFLLLWVVGGGAYSLDAVLRGRRR